MLKLTSKEGCTKIFADKISGTKKERPEWDKLLEYARNGDVIVITELSRMSRSLSHLLEIVKIFDERIFKSSLFVRI